ncbi:MAG: M48 family metalloprotease [Planctomycetota bacterium]|nr:M48 family metalloprotease [Planctomycetota bacterium]
MSVLSQALGSAVTHFLWQGAVLGLVVVGAQHLWARGAARARHDLALAGLLASWVTFLATLRMELQSARAAVELEGLQAQLGALLLGEVVDLPVPPATPEPLGPWIGASWCLGMAFMALRVLRGMRGARALRVQAALPSDGRLQATVDELRGLLTLRRPVRVLEHPGLASPAVVGWWEPVILVPLALGARLSPAQVRAVLAHELAHIRRSDHLVNALLTASEVVLFFHPLTWWLLRTLRTEREHCCDDLAAAATQEPRLLAEALTQLEDLRLATQAALAARPKEGNLMIRIRRLLETRSRAPRRALGPVALAALALSTGMAGAYAKGGLEASPTMTLAEVGEAQDGDLASIERRLRAAVEAGLLTEAEAERTLGALRRLARREGAPDKAPPSEDVRRAAERIEAGIKAGKLTEEEGRERLRQMRAKLEGDRSPALDPEQQRAMRERYAAAEARVKAGIEAGKITEAEGKQRLEAVRRELFGGGEVRGAQRPQSDSPRAMSQGSTAQRERRMRFAKVEAEIKEAVEAGKLSREEASAKLKQLRAEMATEAAKERDAQGAPPELQREQLQRYAEAKARLEAGVKAGKLTEAQAKLRLQELRREMAGQGAAAEASPQRMKDLELRERSAAVRQKLQKAVEAGKLSPDEAKAKLLQMRKEMLEGKAPAAKKDPAPASKSKAKKAPKKDAKAPSGRGEPGKDA